MSWFSSTGAVNHSLIFQVRRQLDRIALHCCSQEAVNPLVFQHSWITPLVRVGITDRVIMAVVWRTQDSRLLKTYMHLTGRDVDNEMVKQFGSGEDPRFSCDGMDDIHARGP